MKKRIPLSLFIKSDVTDFAIDPLPSATAGQSEYRFDIDSDQIFTLTVSVHKLNPGNAVIIEKILVNGIELNHMDSFGLYTTQTGIKKSNGYMDEVGSYKFKIRYNALIHNYLNFLVSSST